MKSVAVLAEGAWGTAVATLLADNGYLVNLWCYQCDLVEKINSTHCNDRYLPGINLDKNIKAFSDMEKAIEGVEWIFHATPIQYMRTILERLKPFIKTSQRIVLLSKGIEKDSLLFPTQIVDEVFARRVEAVIFSGPTFAYDVARQQVSAGIIAASNNTIALKLEALLKNTYFRTYISHDVIGVQASAAFKNVIALGVGILDGAGYTDNTKAFFVTRSLQEMSICIQFLGGLEKTVYDLAGVGDVILTALGSLSRNVEIGRRLGKGQALEDALYQTKLIPEGINSVQGLYKLAKERKIELSLCKDIHEIIFNKLVISDLIKTLMNK